jgi:TBC1 domain family member 5
MPESVYFRQPQTQTMLLDILFVFCKLNPDVGYRQGMHELLAPIVWVVERDAIDTKQHWKTTGGNVTGDSLLFELLDKRCVEADAFTLFGLVMQNAKSFFEPGEERGKGRTTGESDAPILSRIKRIYGRYLPEVDPELAAHLKAIEVVPQVFLM